MRRRSSCWLDDSTDSSTNVAAFRSADPATKCYTNFCSYCGTVCNANSVTISVANNAFPDGFANCRPIFVAVSQPYNISNRGT